MKQLFKSKPLLAPAAILGASLIIYLLGFKLLLVPALLGCIAWYLPFPHIFRSFASRLVAGFLILISFLMAASAAQFFIFPDTGFIVPAVLVTVISMVAIMFMDRYRPKERVVLWEKKDKAATIVVALFALPALLATGLSATSIVRFGGIQSTDGANHYVIIDEMSRTEHFSYEGGGSYYPKGFHLTTAFMQDSFHVNQSDLSFGLRVRLFVVQYLVYGALLGYLLFYLCSMVFGLITAGLKRQHDMWLALSVGVPLSIFYLLPFLYQGFLPYYYSVAIVVCGLVYIWGAYEKGQKKETELSRWFLTCYLLLVFGVSMSWTLFAPVMLLIPLFYLLPSSLRARQVPGLLRRSVSKQNMPVLAALSLQLIPAYLQSKYSGAGGAWFNVPGSISAFHFGVHIFGLGVVAYFMLSDRMPDAFRQFVARTFQPLYIFIAVLVTIQYFSAGELRYYSIKAAFLVEIVLLAVAAAWIVHLYANSKLDWLQRSAMPVLLLTIGGMLLMGLNTNPLKDLREVYRDHSAFGRPAFFDSDVKGLVDLSSGGKVHSANAIVLHHDSESDKLYGNLMISNWVAVMQPQEAQSETRRCSSELFTIVTYKEISPQQQADLKSKVKECASLAFAQKREYYIVTDDASAPHIKYLFGDSASITR